MVDAICRTPKDPLQFEHEAWRQQRVGTAGAVDANASSDTSRPLKSLNSRWHRGSAQQCEMDRPCT